MLLNIQIGSMGVLKDEKAQLPISLDFNADKTQSQ